MAEENLIQKPPTPENVLTPQYIVKNFKTLTEEEIRISLQKPELANHLLSVVSKFGDEQLKYAVRAMSLDQIKATIPKLQLQQTGVCIQAMNPSQLRQAISSLTNEDKNLLMGNISLLTASSSKDELQSFISFVDPLAMCIAIKIPDLAKKLIESSAVMTPDQIHVIVPLLTNEQIREMFKVLQSEELISIGINMLDDKIELMKLLKGDLPQLESKLDNTTPELQLIKKRLSDIEIVVQKFSFDRKEGNHQEISRKLKNIKTQIELVQQTLRELHSSLTLPLKLVTQEEDKETGEKFNALENSCKEALREAHHQFSSLDKLISEFNKQFQRIESEEIAPLHLEDSAPNLKSSSDAIYEDDDRALRLYEAIKQIGNPDAIGNYYPMSWNQIIEAGFRTVDDFHRAGIENLEQLQKHLNNN